MASAVSGVQAVLLLRHVVVNVIPPALFSIVEFVSLSHSLYVIVGRIESPGGKSPLVKTIWIVDSGLETARLVTAYPHNE